MISPYHLEDIDENKRNCKPIEGEKEQDQSLPNTDDESESDDTYEEEFNLPPVQYPRDVEKKRKPTVGYYVALGLVLSVWMITPLSSAYLVWYTVIGRGYLGSGLTSTLFAAYALTETLFAVYYHYLVVWAQKSPPPLSPKAISFRKRQFHRVLFQNLTLGHFLKSHIDESIFSNPIINGESQICKPKSRRRRCGMLTSTELNVLNLFVEDQPGDRERLLREQVENNLEPALKLGKKQVPILDIDDPLAIEFRERMRTWFNHAPWESIKRDNIESWLSWLIFGVSSSSSPLITRVPENVDFLNQSIKQLEARAGWEFPKGFNRELEIMRLTIDPVVAKGRPLAVYALSYLGNSILIDLIYPGMGLGLYCQGRIEYLVRMPTGWSPELMNDPNSIPIVFFHGLGFGMLQNQLFIRHLLSSLPKHPVIIPISHHTSQSIFHPYHLQPWTKSELCNAIQALCQRWGFWTKPGQGRTMSGGISVLSHSNGSVFHSWLLSTCPEIIKRNTFVDPVVFCLWEGDVCYSFCYRSPATVLELLLNYFIATEVGIAHYIQRHFDWAENTLFVEDIPEYKDCTKTAFFLGGQDLIIDSAQVRRYLERRGVPVVHWDPHGGHGDALSGASRERVINFVSTGFTRGWQGHLRGLQLDRCKRKIKR